ncbi:MAG: BrnT family toxin [Elusimicrobia bacterium]|nr:BrnT family toxin [Elusimicrobiota bacterium]
MSGGGRYGSFVWNALKEKANVQRHGLGFHDATEVFADPRRIIARDDRHSKDEERLFCVGSIHGRVITVRFTFRGKCVRIFGAGYWRKGRKAYEKANLHR